MPNQLTKIIKCKDCKFWQDAEYGIVEVPICERLTEKWTHKKGDTWFIMGSEDFCSYGERK